jgi:hypothetical protein
MIRKIHSISHVTYFTTNCNRSVSWSSMQFNLSSLKPYIFFSYCFTQDAPWTISQYSKHWGSNI